MGRTIISKRDIEEYQSGSLNKPAESTVAIENMPPISITEHAKSPLIKDTLSKMLDLPNGSGIKTASQRPDHPAPGTPPKLDEELTPAVPLEQPTPDASPHEPATASPTADDYTTRLMKYIPAEVIALYLTFDSIIRSNDQAPALIHWLVFGFGLIVTYFYLARVAKVTKKKQLSLSVAAFGVWVFALGGPFDMLAWYEPFYGGLLLPAYTFLIPIIEA